MKRTQHTMSKNTDIYEIRSTAWVISLRGKSCHDNQSTTVEIIDEGAGEYVRITQPDTDQGIAVNDMQEWNEISRVVDAAMVNIGLHERIAKEVAK